MSDGKVVEVKGNEMMAGYVGQTAPRVLELLEQARGGVLFIDEAYALNPSRAGNVFAKEALETLLAAMTDPKYQVGGGEGGWG